MRNAKVATGVFVILGGLVLWLGTAVGLIYLHATETVHDHVCVHTAPHNFQHGTAGTIAIAAVTIGFALILSIATTVWGLWMIENRNKHWNL